MQHRRAGRPKSRNGCSTCKARHVRCDEDRPACGQCVSTGRKCDGYNPGLTQKQLHENVLEAYQHRVPPNPDNRIAVYQGTPEEREYVHTFCTLTSPVFSGFFVSELWGHLLPQLSHTEPAVRHAITAVAAAHRRYIGIAGSQGSEEEFILQQYNRAIRVLVDGHLSTAQRTHTSQPNLTLVNCCLFACLEMLHSNHQQALDHVDAGLQLMWQDQSAHRGPGNLPVLDLELWDHFSRLHMDLAMFGHRTWPSVVGSEEVHIPRSFSDITQSRRILTKLMNKTMIASPNTNLQPLLLHPNMREHDQGFLQSQHELMTHQSLYAAWSDTFNRFLQTRQGKAADQRSVLALRIDHHFAILWTLSTTAMDEMEYDRYGSYFENIVRMAKNLLHLERSAQNSVSEMRPFCPEPGVLRALQLTATKCRDPLLRREALRIMSDNPRKESVWDWRRSVRLGKFFIRVEEAELRDLPVKHRVPGERNRIVHYQVWDNWGASETRVQLWLWSDWSRLQEIWSGTFKLKPTMPTRCD
ncbi:hypothetical protein P168DRAFT_283461 [Aspergillus campestris IBT 28561]|uniref:Zn(2)-C6 fungal-type domain-containing protein n=1 Tax=Aspergillus campestris (strain IBT 28561) TaxID=1392248 RepID=A0A2I1CYL4_ASPC2|nr:uncharacterized protein P168DRAFT_283461 [Aspergillus campestris IBT 28561]PKY02705.1 hypothetical protein P168DRAFT_283461 [Aspergillus campestris IBT 28561]